MPPADAATATMSNAAPGNGNPVTAGAGCRGAYI
jgi:hypothetical protein